MTANLVRCGDAKAWDRKHDGGKEERLMKRRDLLKAAGAGGVALWANGLSSELGALVLGALVAGHPRAGDLKTSLWNMKDVLLTLFDFSDADITTCTDLDADKGAIERGLADLVDGAQAGDVLYFHFSGHGSNVPDNNGDEADNRDEIFCPTDLNWQDPLLDDSFRTVLDQVPEGVNLTMVTDCCHSGTITRAIQPPDAPVIGRYLPCPLDLWAVVWT